VVNYLSLNNQAWVWKYLEEDANHAEMARALEHGNITAVTEGSYFPERDKTRGAAAWVLECQDSGARIECALRSPGIIANAYRSELSGMYAILVYINALVTVYKVQSGRATIGCDNKVALEKSETEDRKIRLVLKHSDVIRAIQLFRHNIPTSIRLTFVHVRGHQDKNVHFRDLPRIAQLNVQMDTMAKAFLAEQIDNPDKIGDHYYGTRTRVRIG
jgi:hypothetical protein